MSFFTNNQNNKPKPQTSADRTRKELNAKKQLLRLEDHLNSENTTVRLDKTTSSRSGKKRRRYIVSENGLEKYRADFIEENRKQELVQLVRIKRTKKYGGSKK